MEIKSRIYCEDCLMTMKKRISENSVDMVLTSPPYNINRHDFQYDKYKDKKIVKNILILF